MRPSILITGVGAVIGQGIIKSLRDRQLPFQLIGIDANPHSVGFRWTDAAYAVPRADDSSWADTLIDICKKENVVLILPGIEQDVKALIKSRARFSEETGALTLLNSATALEVGLDKWELCRFAVKNDIRIPLTFLLSEVNSDEISGSVYPLLLKPRRGMAGKGIYNVETRADLDSRIKEVNVSGYILQQYVGSLDEEYTVSIFGFRDGTLSEPFALKRKLNYGSTFEAETVNDPELSKEVSRIAGLMKVIGPTNLQFRKSGGLYYLLEVNPRFSSSTSIKSAFGFNEPLMAVRSFISGDENIRMELREGRCYRYIEDMVTFT